MRKANLVLTILAIALSQQCLAQGVGETRPECKEHVPFNDSTWYPPQSFRDYVPQKTFAHLALPKIENQVRIWVKGNSEYRFVQAFEGRNHLGHPVTLDSPYYTAIIELPWARELNIHFGSTAKNLSFSKNMHRLTPLKKEETGEFSILAYGCFEPFITNEDKMPSLISEDDNPLNWEMRRLFSAVGTGQAIEYQPFYRNNKRLRHELPGEIATLPLTSPPSLIIGTGDQIYTDAGHEFDIGSETFSAHPMSAWAYTCVDPYPLLNQAEYVNHLHRTYQAFSSFQTLDAVFRQVPCFGVWDDHDIRDGWGSHGDEYAEDGSLNPALAPYFHISRQAYLSHQWAKGPQQLTDTLLIGNQPLHQTFAVQDVKVFALDLRSERDINRQQVMGEGQFQAFETWLDALDSGEKVLIVSSMPLFFHFGKLVESAVKAGNRELIDDINDSWYSNVKQRDRLIKAVVEARVTKDIRPVFLSGDIHTGVISEVWYNDVSERDRANRRKVLGYELIASGLSNETLGEAKVGGLRKFLTKRASRRSDYTLDSLDGHRFHIFPELKQTIANVNFGAVGYKADAPDEIYLFSPDKEGLAIEQFVVTMDWEKSYREERKTHYYNTYALVTNTLLLRWIFGNRSYRTTVPEHRVLKMAP